MGHLRLIDATGQNDSKAQLIDQAHLSFVFGQDFYYEWNQYPIQQGHEQNRKNDCFHNFAKSV